MAKTDSCIAYTISYSAQTKLRNLNEMFELKLAKKPLECYGAQSTIEILRQVIDQEGYHEMVEMLFENVRDVGFASAGAGRSKENPHDYRNAEYSRSAESVRQR
ncbi:hypothetical protein F442_02539 [Phytophthora nicotianae P10297]|uniref:Uncharacterized protein n=1 Tax=Phytophthora nicotianae P10297 TaxID=1317064 RepID=W2ZZK0_PHYNI|nr:hypothetical protein F442_02539 [Phytophthora nicotianae P10297]